MSTCCRCHAAVYIADGLEFDEDVDLCCACLTEEVVALRAFRDAAVPLLKELEWYDLDVDNEAQRCPECVRMQRRGHADDCRLAAALTLAEESP